jgi:hypothetical protein
MSDSADKFFKAMAGRSLSEHARLAPADSSVDKILKSKRSKFPLFRIGWHQAGELLLTEEERLHFHVLGLPGKGKSKFLELLARHDIDRLTVSLKGKTRRKAPGMCLIDSSDFGNTFYKVLRHCRSVGYNKVCVIDPNDFYTGIGKVPVINPFGKLVERQGRIQYDTLPSVVSSSLANVFRVLWETEDFSRIARIQEFFKAVIDVIHGANGTLADVECFTARGDDAYKARRDAILAANHRGSHSRVILDEMFDRTNQSTFNTEFRSTIRRVSPVFERPLPLIVGSNRDPIDFAKLISDGWVILCNLDPQIWDVPQQRLLGTLVISECVQAMYSLVRSGYSVPFYLVIDEIGRYATETISEVIDYKRTSNIRLVMAHQRYDQIRNEGVRSAIESVPNKVMFYCERADRDRMVRNMYGGDLPEHMVSYNLSQELEKQKAVIKLGLSRPRLTRIADVPDVPPVKARDAEFKAALYERPWYRTRDEAEKEINDRFSGAPVYGAPGAYRAKRAPKQEAEAAEATDKVQAVGPSGGRDERGKDTGGVGPGRVPDGPAGRPPLLRRPEGREPGGPREGEA